MRGLATGVGTNANIGAYSLTELAFISGRPKTRLLPVA
jgi:hypothetical protein